MADIYLTLLSNVIFYFLVLIIIIYKSVVVLYNTGTRLKYDFSISPPYFRVIGFSYLYVYTYLLLFC